EVSGYNLKVMGRGSGSEAVLLRFGGKLLRVGLLLLGFLLARERGLDGGLDFAQRSGMRRLFLFDLNDVIAVLGANEAGGLSGLERKGSLIEFRNGSSVLEEAEFAALLLAAGVVGVFLREIGEVSTVVQLVEDALRLGLRRGVSLRIGTVDLYEDVADLHLVLDLIVLQVLVVVLLNLGVSNLRGALGEVAVGEG